MKISIKKKDWIEIALHIAFWSGVFYTLLLLTVPHIKMRLDYNGTIVQRDISHILTPDVFLAFGLLIILFYVNGLWLLKRSLYYKNILVRVFLPLVWFFAILLAHNYLDTLVPAQIKRDPVVNIVQQFQNKKQLTIHAFAPDSVKIALPPLAGIQRDRFVVRDHASFFAEDGFSNTEFLIFIIVFGLSIAWFFLKEWARTEKFRLQLEAVQLDTEIKFLKSQVNPHFLFNTLNNLFSMAQLKGNDELADGISKLSGMMRYMIYESNEENVPLKKEIEYLENCILLNELRYADNEVKVLFNYPAQTKGVLVAPMLFIPFVENAFKHGVAIGQSSEIDISISVTNKQLVFTCQNTIYSVKKMDDEKIGIGLENVKRRLKLVYPDKHELTIKDNGIKFVVELQINLEQ
jgi:two-component system LytT family sensor kinase